MFPGGIDEIPRSGDTGSLPHPIGPQRTIAEKDDTRGNIGYGNGVFVGICETTGRIAVVKKLE